MDGLIGLSSRRLHRYTNNLGIQKIGMYNHMDYNANQKLQVVGYYDSSVSVSTVLGSPGIQSPPMYLKAGDVVYVMGCEGYIGSTTAATAATTFANQGRANVWAPYIINTRTGVQSFASWQESAMLNARQNEWSPSNFVSTDWASVSTGQVATLGTYRTFLALKIIRVTETGMYNIYTAYGPRGTGSQSRHVYCIAFRGADIANLSNVYFEPSATQTKFVKSPRSRISTGTFSVGVYDAYLNTNVFGIDQYFIQGQAYKAIFIGMISELDLISSDGDRIKLNSNYNNGFIGSLWSDQYDGSAGLSSMCGIDASPYVDYGLTYNHSGNRAVTAGLMISSCYEIMVPSL